MQTGFAKAFEWIRKSNTAGDAILVYQYRGKFSKPLRPDGTPEPEPNIKDQLPGKDYVLQTMARRKSDPKFLEDLKAVEGGVYLVKCTQLVFSKGATDTGHRLAASLTRKARAARVAMWLPPMFTRKR